MIKDNIKNANIYYNLSPLMETAFKFLETTDFSQYKKGSYEIKARDIYMNVEEYTTRVSSNVEAHKKYIDIQFMISGEENMGVASLDELTVSEEYDDQRDVAFYKGDVQKILVKENEFIVFFPTDAHLPCQVVDESRHVKKVIVKIKMA